MRGGFFVVFVSCSFRKSADLDWAVLTRPVQKDRHRNQYNEQNHIKFFEGKAHWRRLFF
jgi:hypothetical protein